MTTVSSCSATESPGLAAEAAFFAIVSMPPLIFAMAGSIGYVTEQFSSDRGGGGPAGVIDLFSTFLTDRAVNEVIVPTMNDVLRAGAST